jgi:SagB-type dehydrogenase family enzyme
VLFRRVPTLVGSWQGGEFKVRNYATRTSASVQPSELIVLHALTHWRSLKELLRQFTALSRRELVGLLSRLGEARAVESSEQPPDPTQQALTTWTDWSPAAAYLHFDTKDLRFADEEMTDEILRTWEALDPFPSVVKTVRGARVRLDDFPRRGVFPSVLLERRSWRRFGARALTRRQLSMLLGLTWATQQWVHVSPDIKLALKTSPSGGACHSIEVYVAVQNVRGFHPGVYHYCHDSHTLVRLKQKWTARWIGRCLAGQTWFARAGAVMFMTSVFPRVQWKYRSSRAYRTVLLEAGHFCQTFCLTATWLGLAPFCTAAFADSLIERGVGVDGVTESVVYVAGVGTRPAGIGWAPYPFSRIEPRTSPPGYRQTGQTLDPTVRRRKRR